MQKSRADTNRRALGGIIQKLNKLWYSLFAKERITVIEDLDRVLIRDNSDDLTYKYILGSDFKAAAGTGGTPMYIYIKATSQNEGDLHLSDVINWNVSTAFITSITVITSSTDWDLYILQNDNGYSTNDANIPKRVLNVGGNGEETILEDFAYEDEDGTNEVHLYWIDNSGSNTADFYITGYELST